MPEDKTQYRYHIPLGDWYAMSDLLRRTEAETGIIMSWPELQHVVQQTEVQLRQEKKRLFGVVLEVENRPLSNRHHETDWLQVIVLREKDGWYVRDVNLITGYVWATHSIAPGESFCKAKIRK